MFMRKKYSLVIIGLLIISFGIIIVSHLYNKNKRKEELQKIVEVSDNDIVFGASDAPLSLLIYFNYNCSFCNKFFEKVYPQLYSEYIKAGKVKVILRLICSGNSLNELYANQAAICINKHGDYKKLHELFLHNYKIIFTEEFRQLVEDFIFMNDELARCLLEPDDYKVLKDNLKQFNQLNLAGTPAFVIGDRMIQGYRDFDYLKKIIETYD